MMAAMYDPMLLEAIPSWVEHSLARSENILATSNQGTLLLCEENGLDLVVKTFMGSGLLRYTRRTTLRREYEAYQRLSHLTGVPKCFGFLQDRYLLIEHIRGAPYRDAVLVDRNAWFDELLDIIQEFHCRGVAHGDLKSKSNLLNTDQGKPCVIDFGTTVFQKAGFHPVNNRMFEYLKRLDLNAWVKHKYHGRYEDVSNHDRALLDYSGVEGVLRRYRRWRDG